MKKLVKVRLINWHYLSNETIEIKGNTLLTGPNASGKSTIMDAITYVLTAGDTAFNLAANDKGKRDLNELEQKVMNGWKQIANTPEFKKREEYDLISDGSSTYYQKKFYFDNSSCPYLFTDTERLSYSIEDNKVRDSKIKGKCILKYKVHKI